MIVHVIASTLVRRIEHEVITYAGLVSNRARTERDMSLGNLFRSRPTHCQEGRMDSLTRPPKEGERALVSPRAHLPRCLPRTASATSAVPGFIALPRPNNHRIARVPFARSMLLIPLYLPPCHCQTREAGLYRGWSHRVCIFLEVDCL